MIIGADIGYAYTKVWTRDDKFCFKSTIEEGILDICNTLKVEFEDKQYTVGENSENSLYDNNVNKITSLNFKLCLYTAIAKAMKNEMVAEVKLVTGLPASYYSSQKDDLINELKDKTITLALNNEPKMFTITDVIVFPQSAGVLILNPEKLMGDVCVCDIGGFTVDVSYFNNRKLKRLFTFELGMNILGKALVDEIRSEYNVTYDILRADDLLDGKTIAKNGKPIDISNLVDEVLNRHTNIVINRLESIKEFNTSTRIFIGGGSLRLKKYLNEEFIEQDTIYTNARSFYILGVSKFGKK
ncbi:TPA: StbA family protein [Clostridium perfringens]|nr:ParM/StbA family protein [Clostridium perfringens]